MCVFIYLDLVSWVFHGISGVSAIGLDVKFVEFVGGSFDFGKDWCT